jgi:predicted alpha/beta-hydrolase family hydrolase
LGLSAHLPVQTVKAAKFEDHYDALVDRRTKKRKPEPRRKAVKPRDTGNNAHFTVI